MDAFIISQEKDGCNEKSRNCQQFRDALYRCFEQTVAVAVIIQVTSAPQLQPGLGVALRVEFHQLQPVGGDIGHKGDEMLLGHGVVDRDKVFVLHPLQGDGVRRLTVLCFQRGQGDTAAADEGVAHAVNDVAADGAYIEFAAQHIAADVLVGDVLAVHQLDQGEPQGLGQGLQKADIRQTLAGLPLGDGLAADTDLFCQFRLGEISGFPQIFDGITGYIAVHICHFLSGKSITHKYPLGNLRFVDRRLC